MVEVKGTKTPAAKPARDKAKAAAASKSVQALAGKRKAQRKKKDNAPVFYIAAGVFVVLLAAVSLGAFKKKPSAGLARSPKTADGAITRKARKASGDSTAAPKKKPAARGAAAATATARRAPRASGLRQRQPVASRPQRARPARVPGDRSRKPKQKTVRRVAGSDRLTAIGEGTALIGDRTVRAGDVIRGRVIQEIGSDVVRVEYGGTVFTVRIGEALP